LSRQDRDPGLQDRPGILERLHEVEPHLRVQRSPPQAGST
jgi:hypothetical protein